MERRIGFGYALPGVGLLTFHARHAAVAIGGGDRRQTPLEAELQDEGNMSGGWLPWRLRMTAVGIGHEGHMRVERS